MSRETSQMHSTSNLKANGLEQQETMLSSKNRNLRLQWTQAQKKLATVEVEDWKNVTWSDESGFLLRQENVRVSIWHQQHEYMAPTCLVLTVQACGADVITWGCFLGTLGPLIPGNQHLNATSYPMLLLTTHITSWPQFTIF